MQGKEEKILANERMQGIHSAYLFAERRGRLFEVAISTGVSRTKIKRFELKHVEKKWFAGK